MDNSEIASESKKRVRKWDNPNPIKKCSNDVDSTQDNVCTEEQDKEENKTKFLKASSISEFGFDYDINDLEPIYRSIICLSITLDEIKQNTGATLMVKGKYLTEEEKETSKERPLYLHIKGSTQQIVNAAIAKIKSLVTKTLNPPNASSDQIPDIAKQQLFVQDKVFVGLDRALPAFNLINRILGPQGSYLQHIQISTGAKVSLRGRGSGFIESATGTESIEPLHILIQHATTFGIHQAKCLSSNLIQTIQREYVKFEKEQALLPPTITAGTASMLAGLQQFQNQSADPNYLHPYHIHPPNNNLLHAQMPIGMNHFAHSHNNFSTFIGNTSQSMLGPNMGIPPVPVQYNNDYNMSFPYTPNFCPVSAPTLVPPTVTTGTSRILPVGPPISKAVEVTPVAPPSTPGSNCVHPVSTVTATAAFSPPTSLPVFRLSSFILPSILPGIKKLENCLDLNRSKEDDSKSSDKAEQPCNSTVTDSNVEVVPKGFDCVLPSGNGTVDVANEQSKTENDSLHDEVVAKHNAPIIVDSDKQGNNLSGKNPITNIIKQPFVATPLSSLELPPLEFFANVPPPSLPVESRPKPDANTYYSNFVPSVIKEEDRNKRAVGGGAVKSKKRRFKENKDGDEVDVQNFEKKDAPSFIHPALEAAVSNKDTHTADVNMSTNIYTNNSKDNLSNTDIPPNKILKNDDERLLMPPPSLVVLNPLKSKPEKIVEKKKLKGALGSVAALYGSDDED